MIMIGALVAVCAGLVWRRDGIDGVLKILTHDLWLFGEIMPRVLAGCLLSGYRGNSTARQSLAGARAELGPEGTADRHGVRRDPAGGPSPPIRWRRLLTVGADFGATIAMVVSWTLIGYGRAVAWELPILGTDFTLWRIVISLPSGAGRRARPLRLCADVSEGRAGAAGMTLSALLIDITL